MISGCKIDFLYFIYIYIYIFLRLGRIGPQLLIRLRNGWTGPAGPVEPDGAGWEFWKKNLFIKRAGFE